MTRRRICGVAIAGALVASVLALAAAPAAAAPGSRRSLAVTRLAAAAGGSAVVALRHGSGIATFVGGANPLTPASDDDPIAVADAFLDDNAAAFGVDGVDDELVEDRVSEGVGEHVGVRYQQTYRDLPILGGEVAVQVDGDGQVLSVTGETSPDLDLATTTPAVSAAHATMIALDVTARDDAVARSLLESTAPEPWIYDPELLGAPDALGARLVWRIAVRTALGDVDRLVLVDARTGAVALTFSQRLDARDVQVCDHANIPSAALFCATPITSQNVASLAGTDAGMAFAVSTATYDYYAGNFGRDSIDGAGMAIRSTVRYCPDTSSCPYRNAFWNGSQMVYGEGFAVADDVVAHELTHGVTQHESGLVYYAQSGAINESLSDVFGELLDLDDFTSGADPTDDRWLIGEQLPLYGSIRDMESPTSFGDPDRMTSPYFSRSSSDSYGVHTNSGVNNKAAYLITEGGTFNGQTIVGLGAAKTAKIYYLAQTTLLGPGSDYLDLSRILPQACTNLIGTVTTAGDCEQVTKAVTATEMALRPDGIAQLTAPVCDGSAVLTSTLFSDDMEATNGKWTTGGPTAARWVYSSNSAQSGSRSLHGPDTAVAADAWARMASSVAIPTGATYLRFDHAYGFDHTVSPTQYRDGGVVEYTVNGGTTWTDAAGLGVVNGYVGALSGGANPLGTRSAYSGANFGYQQTRVDVSSLAGRSVAFRFRIGSDDQLAGQGWFVDDVQIYTCVAPATTTTSTTSTTSTTTTTSTTDTTAPTPTTTTTTTMPTTTSTSTSTTSTSTSTSTTSTPTTSTTAPSTTSSPPSTAPPSTTSPATTTPTPTTTAAVPIPPPSTTSTPVAPSGDFVAAGPARVFDTRAGESANAIRRVETSKVGGTKVLEVEVTDLPGLVPAAGVAGVALNVAVTGSDAAGFVSVYPCGQRPEIANVNHGARQTVSNGVIAPVSPRGTVCFFSLVPVDLVVDITGWFPTARGYHASSPARVLDTRSGQSIEALRTVAKRQISGDYVVGVRITDLPGVVPADGVSAVSLNVAVTGSNAAGFVSVYPCGERPLVASVNHGAGETVSNNVIAPVSAAGTVCFYSHVPVDVIVDVNGWFAQGSGYTAAGPARAFDTRRGESPHALRTVAQEKVGGATVLEVKLTDLPGLVPSSGVAAVSLNIAVTGSAAAGFVTAHPCGTVPLSASVNHGAGQTVSNGVIAPVSARGTVCFYSHVPVDLIVDVNGWFAG